MRILVVTNLYPPRVLGGYELACRQAVDALRARGHDVIVLTTTFTGIEPGPSDRPTMMLRNIWDPLVTSQDVRATEEREARLISAHNADILLDTLDDVRPDVVHLWNLLGIGGLGILAALRLRAVPWVWQLGDDVPRSICISDWRLQRGLAQAVYPLFEGSYVACSQGLFNEIEDAGIPLSGPHHVITNWISGSKPPARKRAYREGGVLKVVFAGGVGRHKGVDILIRAAGMLAAQGRDDVSVDIFGTLHDESLLDMIRVARLEKMVHLCGFVEQSELLERYAEYDVFAFPTWTREPFGLGPLEAMARGCVPIVTANCGFSEWFVDGVHCLKVGRNATALASTLATVADGGIDLEPIARRGAAVAWRECHIDTVLPQIEGILETASAARPRRRVLDHERASIALRFGEAMMRSLAG